METEANLFKQSCWAEADGAEEGKIISPKHYGIIGEPPQPHVLYQWKVKSCYSSKSQRIHPFERDIVENIVEFALEWTFQNVNTANRKQVSV